MIDTTAKWFVASGQMPEKPTLDFTQLSFYIGMQLEETAEKLEAILGPESSLPSALQAEAMKFKKGEYSEHLRKKYNSEFAVDLLDADMDLIWVSIGAALALGANPEGAYKAVADANWAKFPNGKVIRDPATGKVVKPAGWRPPDLHAFISEE